MKWHIASVSWGKDSLAMLLMLIAKGYPLNEVVFYDTGMEFEAIYNTRDQMLPCLEQLGIKYTRLEPENPFLFDMLERPVCSKQKGTHQGYGWCGGLCRWGTTGKLKAIDRYAEARDAMVYVGIAADETPRLEKERKPYKLHQLAEWGMTEADALAYCYENGFSWLVLLQQEPAGTAEYVYLPAGILGAPERPATENRQANERLLQRPAARRV